MDNQQLTLSWLEVIMRKGATTWARKGPLYRTEDAVERELCTRAVWEDVEAQKKHGFEIVAEITHQI